LARARDHRAAGHLIRRRPGGGRPAAPCCRPALPRWTGASPPATRWIWSTSAASRYRGWSTTTPRNRPASSAAPPPPSPPSWAHTTNGCAPRRPRPALKGNAVSVTEQARRPASQHRPRDRSAQGQGRGAAGDG
jgi:hypothetical protein